MNIIDAITLFIIVAFALFAFFGNPLKTIKSFVSFAVSFLAASLLLDPVLSLVESFGLKENVYTPLVIYSFLIIVFWGLIFSLILPALPKVKFHSMVFRVIGLFVGAIYGLIFAIFLSGVLPQFLLSPRAIDLVYSSNLARFLQNQQLAKVFKTRYLSSISPRLTQAILVPEEDNTVFHLDLPQNIQSEISTKDESLLYGLTNYARKSAGQGTLIRDNSLDILARNYAAEILSSGNFAHRDKEGNSPDMRAKNMQIKFNYFGENLAFAPTISVAQEGLLNSKGHRANIESPIFRRIGIAVIDVRYYGKIIVEEFAN